MIIVYQVCWQSRKYAVFKVLFHIQERVRSLELMEMEPSRGTAILVGCVLPMGNVGVGFEHSY